MFEQDKEERQLLKRWEELADKSYYNNQYIFTGFLSMAQLDLFYTVMRQLGHKHFQVYGGRDGCERQMVRFGSPQEWGYEEEFPIECIQAEPLMAKFAEELTHRDFLGALMNLGIERTTIGDIYIKDKSGFIFCNSTIAPYILENLTQVRHTHMKCKICDNPLEYKEKEPEKTVLLVASPRTDAVVAKVYQLSRTQSIELFRSKKIFVNGRIYENNSGLLKEGDIISVRGFGKFIYYGIEDETKKGKYRIAAGIYR